jgi:hypothetical protein
MHALLKIGLLAAMLVCCVGMIRQAYRPDSAVLVRATGWLRAVTWANGALLLLWLGMLARP